MIGVCVTLFLLPLFITTSDFTPDSVYHFANSDSGSSSAAEFDLGTPRWQPA